MAPARRNTKSERSSRNTQQLDAFPASDNARKRQGDRLMAVVSIRLDGATIAKLDKLAATWPERRKGYRRYRASRSELIQLAIADYIKRKDG